MVAANTSRTREGRSRRREEEEEEGERRHDGDDDLRFWRDDGAGEEGGGRRPSALLPLPPSAILGQGTVADAVSVASVVVAAGAARQVVASSSWPENIWRETNVGGVCSSQ